MKKINIVLTLILALAVALTGCSTADAKEGASAGKTLKVGATPVPHAELLEKVKPVLAEQGIELEIVEFTDYVKPNLSLNDGEIDANFFQHQPYLDGFNADRGLDLISVGTIHVEPLGAYSQKYASVEEIEDGALIAIPSDGVNGGRALILLQTEGFITLKADAGLEATELDIVENPKNLKFKSIEAAQLPRVLPDVDVAIINGNFAIEADLNPSQDAILLEGAESPYANIVTVKNGYDKVEEIDALLDALQTEDIKKFIEENYGGGVVPAFSKK